MSALGVIAGTGFYSLDSLDDPEQIDVDTSYGLARAVVGGMHGRRVVFLTRHGADHSVPPHLVNYRANIDALRMLGVTEVIAVNVVGGIGLDSGAIAVVDDFLDFTKSRPSTFFDGSTPEGVVHVDMTEPYDRRLRAVLLQAADALGIAVEDTGIYAAFEGPRFETRAEIRMAQAMGATVVGMTGVPEVVLAKERGLPYASICLVANPAAGLGPEITIEDVMAVVADGAETVSRILVEAARRLADAG
ncbi:MAG TPA: S-methyl-5'-thioinosine phosphorylase [Actinobacteria bacterium]|nr:S-methyl-5'-thioinosine phosphorylase [Actinomycetota bacterium]